MKISEHKNRDSYSHKIKSSAICCIIYHAHKPMSLPLGLYDNVSADMTSY